MFIFFISYIVTANLMTKAWSSVSKSCYCFMTSLKLRMPRCGMLYYLLLKQQSLILDLWGWLWILNRLIGDDHMYSCYVILYNLSFLTISTNVILGFPLSLFSPSTWIKSLFHWYIGRCLCPWPNNLKQLFLFFSSIGLGAILIFKQISSFCTYLSL